MRRVLRLVIFTVIAFIIVRTTTFGWRIFSKSNMDTSEEDAELIRRLKQHVYKLSHEIGDRSVFNFSKLEEAEDYIVGQLTSFGYNVEFHKYSVYNKEVKNVIAVKKGKSSPEETIIVGAHYDSCFNPGADDNASSVAGLLELARFISAQETNRSIRFIAFVNEEPPFFKTKDMGSCVYAKFVKERGDDIKAVVVFEMIGYYANKPNSQRYPPFFGFFYPNRGNFICVAGNLKSRWLVKEIKESFRNKTDFPIESVATFGFVPGIDFSDHWWFWREGYPAVMITDTAFYRNPHYHKSSDTYEKLNYAYMARVIEGLREALIDLAG